MLSNIDLKIAKLILLPFLIFILIDCGDNGDDRKSELINSFIGNLSGVWEGGMYPGLYISFSVKEIDDDYYITAASGAYSAI